MSASWGTCCCAVPENREVKIITVAFPWGFYQPFIDADTNENRYLVYTTSLTNSTGNRTEVATLDEDSGAQDVQTTTDPGFDPDTDKGAVVSHVVTATTDTTIYDDGSYVVTLSGPITLATQTAKCAAKLDELVAVEDCKVPLALVDWEDVGSGLEEFQAGWIFPSEDLGTLLPDADWGYNAPVLIPNPIYPWDGKFLINNLGAASIWFYAHYGWSGGSGGTSGSTLHNSLQAVTSPYTAPGEWSLAFGYAIASRSCHSLPDGIGCGTTHVQDVVECTADGTTEMVTSGACGGLELPPGWYCFDWTGIYRPGNPTPIAASWSEVTTPGWMVADEVGSGDFLTYGVINYNGPIPWDLSCCP